MAKVLSLEGRGPGFRPPVGLCEAMGADGLRWSPCHGLPDLMAWTRAWSRPSPSLDRDEGASARLSEDKENLGHLGSQKTRAPGDLRDHSGHIYHCRERSSQERRA